MDLNQWRGLNQLERTHGNPQTGTEAVFHHYGVQEGLLGDGVFGILEDQHHNLWLSTNQGLFKFDPDLPRGQQFKQFTYEHGLQSNTFYTGSHFQSPSGNFYFGGLKGFNVFHPDSIRKTPHCPRSSLPN